jgi:hypothetical protein
MQSSLTLQEPFESCVYQRDNSNIGRIPVAGKVAPGVESVRAVLTPISGPQISYIIQSIAVDKDGNFGGAVEAPGGVYTLSVSVGSVVNIIDRVYVGEIFVLFGHSFMQGGHDQSHQLPATDDRVITLLDGLDERSYKFGKLTDRVGPFHSSPDAWGQLGDKLVKRLGVPVLIYGCAYGGSNVAQNYEVITGVNPRTSKPPGYDYQAKIGHERQPLLPLEDVMQNYVSKTGVRAVLIEHGYNDRGTSTEVFVQRFKAVIDYIRNTYQKPDLAVVLVQEQLTPVDGTLYDVPTAQGLKTLIADYPHVYPGPDFNQAQWAGMFAAHDHLFGPAIDQFATDWNNSLNASFFSTSTPYAGGMPDVFPLVLYNAPATSIKPIDWLIVVAMTAVLVAIIVYKDRKLSFAFLLLLLLGMGRVTGKI